MTAKTVNYTPEQTTKMVADYSAGVTVDQIAEALGKSVCVDFGLLTAPVCNTFVS